MAKISKSNLPPEFERMSKDAAARFKQIKSKHFEVGSFVNLNNRRAEVLERPGDGRMKIRHEDTTVEWVHPFALQHERPPIYPVALAPVTWDVYDATNARAERWRKRCEQARKERDDLAAELKALKG